MFNRFSNIISNLSCHIDLLSRRRNIDDLQSFICTVSALSIYECLKHYFMRPILPLSIALLLIYVITPTSQIYLSNVHTEYLGISGENMWIPAKPMNLTFNVTVKDNILNVTVTLTFNHGGYRVGNVTQEASGNELRGYMDVSMWTGPSIQVITFKNVTYAFTGLKAGEYLFNLYINKDLSGQVKIKIQENTVTLTNQQIQLTPLLTALTAILLVTVVAVIITAVKIVKPKSQHKS